MRQVALVLLVLVGACGSTAVNGRGPHGASSIGRVERGNATWYGGRFQGRTTANGERFDQNALTAAHKKLPFQTRVRVTNLRNGRTVVVRINDRGPYGAGRVIDVSRAAAEKLDMLNSGVVPVKLEVLR